MKEKLIRSLNIRIEFLQSRIDAGDKIGNLEGRLLESKMWLMDITQNYQ
jgi:hypothetical protein